jgi:CheY-like chemotaxis protein
MNGVKKASALIVEDNVPLATCLEMLLEANSFEVCRTVDGAGGLVNIRLMDFDVILCDLVMPGLNGYQLHAAVRQIKPHLCDRFIFMSGYPKSGGPQTAACTARPILWKPFTERDLLTAIEDVLRNTGQKRISPPPRGQSVTA